MSRIVIIGNGIAGITAARHIRKNSDDEIVVISAESRYFFSRTALMYVYMGHMKFKDTMPYEPAFWKKNKINLVNTRIETVNFDQKQLIGSGGLRFDYDELILATGSKTQYYNWPGQQLQGVRGLYSKEDLEYIEALTPQIDTAVIVGGGLIGVELAEMLKSREKKVVMLVRESSFWGNILPADDSLLISKHLEDHGVEVKYGTELLAVLGDNDGKVKAVKTSTGEEIKCQFVGITTGVTPNVDFLRESNIELDKGILVDSYLKTSRPDVYAIGDCAQLREPTSGRKSIEPVWYTGRLMGELVAHNICSSPEAYDPGIWFNSAKFFDIEYQTYGQVLPELASGEEEFYWEEKDQNRALHFVFDEKTRSLKGVNSFGIRLRHEVLERWINEGKRILNVINDLDEANFNPEFSKPFKKKVMEFFLQEYPEFSDEEEPKQVSLEQLLGR